MDSVVLAGTAEGIYECSGKTLRSVENREVRCLQQLGDRTWAVVNRSEIWAQPAGRNWHRVNEIPGGLALCLLPQADRLLVGTSDLRMLIYTADGTSLEETSDFQGLEERESWYSPGQPSPEVRSMTSEPGGTVYANIHVGGILRWKHPEDSQPTIDFHQDVHQVLFDPVNNLLLAATAEGFAMSRDRGNSWTVETAGLHARYLRAVAVAGDTVFVTASGGPGSRSGAVYRRKVLRDESFEKCGTGLPDSLPGNVNTYCIDADGDEVAFGSPDGAIYLSEDRGESWNRIANGLPSIKTVRLRRQQGPGSET